MSLREKYNCLVMHTYYIHSTHFCIIIKLKYILNFFLTVWIVEKNTVKIRYAQTSSCLRIAD